MKTTRLIKNAALALACAATAANAASVFTDDFTAAGTGSWYRIHATNKTLSNTSNQLVFSGLGNDTDGVIARSFISQTIDVGEKITASFDWTQSVGSVSIIRVGLLDVTTGGVGADGWGQQADPADRIDAYQGYYSFLQAGNAGGSSRYHTDSGNPLTIGEQLVNSSTFSTLDNVTQTNQSASLNLNTAYNVVYEIERTGNSAYNTFFGVYDGLTLIKGVSSNTTTISSPTFDAIQIRGQGGTMTLDNISVTVIPEPGTLALVGVALGSLLLFRRKR